MKLGLEVEYDLIGKWLRFVGFWCCGDRDLCVVKLERLGLGIEGF